MRAASRSGAVGAGALAGALGAAVLLAAPAPARAGAWTTVGPMKGPRAFPTLTLLPDGRALAAGGLSTYAGTVASGSAELFDPGTGAWAGAAPMLQARFEHVAASLADGRVLVAGGRGAGAPLQLAEIYDPVTATWSPAAPMHEVRYWCTATRLADGRVLVAGGLKSDASAFEEVEIYDPVADTWASAAPMIDARARHTATLLADGRVLVAGGVGLWNDTGALATAELFEPVHGFWTPAGKMAAPRGQHSATLLADGRVLIAGGEGLNGSLVFPAAAEIYTPATGAWTAAAALHAPRAGHAAAALRDGKVLVAGGHVGADTLRLDSVELYDPGADAWTDDAPMHVARDYAGVALLGDGRLLVAGGSSPLDTISKAQTEVEIYQPVTGTTCASAADCPTGFCVDQICCDTACDGACAVCARAAGATADGACTTLPRDADGACLRPCQSVHDCPPPSVCGAAGHCTDPPPAVSDGSGCRVPLHPAEGAPPWPAAALLLAAAAARRRGRRAAGQARA